MLFNMKMTNFPTKIRIITLILVVEKFELGNPTEYDHI